MEGKRGSPLKGQAAAFSAAFVSTDERTEKVVFASFFFVEIPAFSVNYGAAAAVL